MMKKLVIILAVLLTAAVVNGAEETKSKSWDFTGSMVDFKATFPDPKTRTVKIGKEEDFIIQLKKNVDEKTWIQIKYDTKDSNPDVVGELTLNRKFNQYVEAQLVMDVDTTTGIKLAENAASPGAWIKYYQTDKMSWKFAPYDIDLGMGKDFLITNDTTRLAGSMQQTPGVELSYKSNDKLSMYAGVGAQTIYKKLSNGDKSNESKTGLGFKAGFEYVPSKAASLALALSTNTQVDDIYGTAPIKSAANLLIALKGEKIKFDSEALYEKYNKATGIKTDEYAVLARVKYSVGKISENVKFTPYFRARLISRNALFDNIDYSAKVTGTKIGDHGGLKNAELGGEFELKGGIIINPYFEYLKAKNNIYADNDGVAKKKDSNLNFTTRVKINF